MMRVIRGCVALGLVAMGACGGDGGGGGGSGVASGKLLLDITNEDAVALCTFANEGFAGVFASAEAYCTYYAGDEDAQACEEERDACLDAGDYEEDLNVEQDCDQADATYLTDGLDPACKATVADYEACNRQLRQLQRAAAASATCDGKYSAAEDAEYEEFENPTVCKKLADCYADS